MDKQEGKGMIGREWEEEGAWEGLRHGNQEVGAGGADRRRRKSHRKYWESCSS